MLMPIVSMNKMAMNESVAATCCFQEVASPTNVYWEVLNGGWIGSGFVETKNWKQPNPTILKDWAKCYGSDVTMKPSTGNTYVIPYLSVSCCDDKIWVAVGGTGNYWNGTYTTGAAGENPAKAGEFNLYTMVANDDIRIGDRCAHNSTDCKYLDFEIQHLSNRHWEAVRAHGGISDWAKPHEAVRFHS